MTNLITRARKEWTHSHPDHEGQGWHYRAPCPPEVVAALLDVLTNYLRTCDSTECVMPCCQTPSYMPHKSTCPIMTAEAAIAKALKALEGV